MKIEFFDLLESAGWEPVSYDQADPNFFWEGGGALADASVNVAATFDGAVSRSTRVDPDFTMSGIQLRPGFAFPWHSHNLRQLIIVNSGELIASEDGETRTLVAGDFWITEADSKHQMTAGPEGAIYVVTWPVWVQLKTTWYPGEGWIDN
ncbi:MAG: hypothetical protein C0482_21885 [Gordonia sp.]|nr:hypothetical protein [Gordonia sp. (in: high G+C Gram-positive bacteria)]